METNQIDAYYVSFLKQNYIFLTYNILNHYRFQVLITKQVEFIDYLLKLKLDLSIVFNYNLSTLLENIGIDEIDLGKLCSLF